MEDPFARTALLLGERAMERLKASRVAVFGIGGVGGYAVEALARSGVGALDLIDSDTVDVTNINRQIIATHASVGRCKVDVMAERVLDINPDCTVTAHRCFFLPETEGQFDFLEYSYVVDAVDTVTAKLALAAACDRADVPLISCMGAGNKLDPTAFEVADIYETSVCPLAKVMRRELKKRGIAKLKVVYSREEPRTRNPLSKENAPKQEGAAEDRRKIPPASIAFVPSVAGLILAGEVVRDLIQET